MKKSMDQLKLAGRVLRVVSASLAVSACCTTAPSSAGAAAVTNDRLTFFNEPAAKDEITRPLQFQLTSGGAVSSDDATTQLANWDKLHHLDAVCGSAPAPAVKPAIIPILASLAAWGISEAIGWVVDTVDSELQQEIKKHVVDHTADSGGFDFYGTLSPAGPLATNHTMCFRASYFGLSDKANPKSPQTDLIDFIGRITYDVSAKEIIRIEPIRLFYQRVDTPTASGKVVVAVQFTANVVALGQSSAQAENPAINVAIAQDTLDTSVISGSATTITDSEGRTVHVFYHVYADDKKPPKPTEVPLPPWDNNPPSNLPANNRMEVSLTIKDTGDVDWLTQHLADLLDKNKDSVSKALVSEAQKAAGVGGQ